MAGFGEGALADLFFGDKQGAAGFLIGILRLVSHERQMALLDEGRDVHDEAGAHVGIEAGVDDLEGAMGLAAGDWPWLASATLIGGIVAPALLMTGLAHADAASASLLLNLEVVFTAVLAWVVFKEPAGSRVVLGLAAIFVGGLLLVWPTRFSGGGSGLLT